MHRGSRLGRKNARTGHAIGWHFRAGTRLAGPIGKPGRRNPWKQATKWGLAIQRHLEPRWGGRASSRARSLLPHRSATEQNQILGGNAERPFDTRGRMIYLVEECPGRVRASAWS